MVVLLIYLFAFLFGFLLILGLGYRPEAWVVVKRLQDISEGGDAGIEAAIANRYRVAWWERVGLPALRLLGKALVRFTPVGYPERLQARLEAAGAHGKFGALEFVGVRLLCLLLAAGGILLSYWWQEAGPLRLALWILIAVVGYLLPQATLDGAVSRRQAAIRRSMPDILDLLVVSVEAGLGLDGAMQKVVDKVKSPLAEEFDRVLGEVRLGKPRSAALRDMAKRVSLTELSSFVAALYQAEVLGVSIAHVLTVQAETVRERRRHLAREQAARLPVKMLVPLVFFIFPGLFVILLGPAAIQIQAQVFRVLGR